MTDEQLPVGIGEATNYLEAHVITGAFKEVVRGRSADSSIAYWSASSWTAVIWVPMPMPRSGNSIPRWRTGD